eukprot:1100422-Amphidinium_carterae.1
MLNMWSRGNEPTIQSIGGCAAECQLVNRVAGTGPMVSCQERMCSCFMRKGQMHGRSYGCYSMQTSFTHTRF